MMAGEGPEEELGTEEARAMEDWPPPTTNMEVTNKDSSSSSRLLFLTVQYVGDEANTSFQTGLENFSELGQRVVSPLDPNMGCTTCYSPVYAPAVSPTGGYLTAATPPSTSSGLQEQGMIVLSEPCQLTAPDSYVVSNPAQPGRVYGDEGKLLLLTDSNPPTEMLVGGNGEQRVELLLSNGTIAYGIVEATDSNGTRIIQIPREYLIAARPQNTDISEEVVSRQEATVSEENIQDENGQIRALYNTLKEQGLIIESGDLQVETGDPLIDPSLMDHTTLVPESTGTLLPLPQAQQRFWCEECNVLLDSNYCMEHQINRKISDKAVPSRARATLPASYLAINSIADSDIEEYGVFARKTIPKRTQFGPMEGVPIKVEEVIVVQEAPHLVLTVENELGELRALDVSNEHMSNWMRFVRIATPERPPNLLVSQLGASLFFTSTHNIHAREELLVWYSPAYALRRNLPADPPPPVWSCSTCGEKLRNHTELMDHSTRHIKKSKRQENLTVNSLRQKNQAFVATVNRDITERNAQKCRFECAVCNKRFIRSYSLKRHILLLHTRENKYHCKVCHLGFSHVYNRLRHMRKAHPAHTSPAPRSVKRYESWSCSHCKLTFSSASVLNLHLLVHAANNVEENIKIEEFCRPQELVSCPQCSQKFSNNRKLASHVAEHGKNKDSQDKKFHCDLCGRNFISAVRFQVHKELHGDDERKPLQCHICKKRLLTQSALTCHLKIHDCNVQWECPMCKQQFASVYMLRAHVHTHAVEGLYSCPHCDKSFEEYSGIRKHVRAFHCARTHVCKDCGKSFPSQDKLRMHLLRHSDRREFLCADCGKQFKRKDKLKEHMKRIHSSNKKGDFVSPEKCPSPDKKVFSKLVVNMSDYERYIYKCHSCVLGFKRRGMLVNHLANRHPDITPESVPELNLPILKTTRDYYCQYCDKIYKSSSKRKAHILKNHPGLELPMSNRQKGGVPEIPGLPNPTFSQTVGSVTTNPHGCQWCHKQYASKAKLLQHQRKKHVHLLPHSDQIPRPLKTLELEDNIEIDVKGHGKMEPIVYEAIVDGKPVPVALSTNTGHHLTLSTANLSQLQEYEIASSEYGVTANGVLIDTSSIIKKSACKIPRPLKNLELEENIGKDMKGDGKLESITFESIVDGAPVPVALSTNINHHMTLSTTTLNQLQEYEIVTSEYDVTANGVLVDASSIIKKSGYKNDDLLSQAMSEIEVSLSDLRALTTEQYLKLLQSPGGPDSLYSLPYPAR